MHIKDPDHLFKSIPESEIRSVKIKSALRFFLEGKAFRLIFIKNIMLGKDAGSDLVKGRGQHGLDGLSDQFLRLMHHRIHGRSERPAQCTVLKPQGCPIRFYQTVVYPVITGYTFLFAFPVKKSGHFPMNDSCLLRKITHHIFPVPGIKTIDLFLNPLTDKSPFQVNLCPGP